MMLYGHSWADTWHFVKSRVMYDLRKCLMIGWIWQYSQFALFAPSEISADADARFCSINYIQASSLRTLIQEGLKVKNKLRFSKSLSSASNNRRKAFSLPHRALHPKRQLSLLLLRVRRYRSLSHESIDTRLTKEYCIGGISKIASPFDYLLSSHGAQTANKRKQSKNPNRRGWTCPYLHTSSAYAAIGITALHWIGSNSLRERCVRDTSFGELTSLFAISRGGRLTNAEVDSLVEACAQVLLIDSANWSRVLVLHIVPWSSKKRRDKSMRHFDKEICSTLGDDNDKTQTAENPECGASQQKT
eukprot:IDg8310t1